MPTATENFDPFKSRLARDIRNSLAAAFLQALSGRDPLIFRRKAGEYLEQGLEDPHRDYILERLKKYDAVYELTTGSGIRGRMQLAGILWTHGLYFEMHDLLENAWLNAEGPRRRGLQGLIRAAGMKIHTESGNMKAAASMGRKAQADLKLCGSSLADFADLASVAAEVDRMLAGTENLWKIRSLN